MGKSLTYFDMAENDYRFLSEDFKNNRVGNVMCYASQNICERYLKHIIELIDYEEDVTDVLRTHSLKKLMKFMKKNISNFICDWDTVLKADGYFFSTRYPGDESFMADNEDVKICWDAVEATRNAVIDFMQSNNDAAKKKSILEDEGVIKALGEF